MKSAKRKSNRVENILDMEKGFDLNQAIIEASRCLLCYDAPCSQECPADTDPGTFIRKLRFRDIKGAVRTIKENNILGGICGIVCPNEKLCQKACSATEIDRPIEIGKLQRFLVEYAWETGFDPLRKGAKRKEKVAIVGSGPAGLSCAAELARAGFDVTVFESKEKPGGVLRYGVPEFRLNSEFLDREMEDIKKLGVKIRCKSRIGAKGVDNLIKKGFKAVFVATGLWTPYKIKIPGSDLKNVVTATEFLASVRSGNKAKIRALVKNKNVAIIGGGSVAMDVASTCKGLGAKKVYCICLESLAEIPAAKDDLEMARDNFVIIKPQCQVTEIIGQRGRVAGVKGGETEWVKPNLFIPSNARPVSGTEFDLKVNTVVMAIGSGPDPGIRNLSSKIKYKRNNLINTKRDGVSTADKKIFAGGDIVRGPALAVEAVADGKEAAKKIIKSLGKENIQLARRIKMAKTKDLSIEMCGVRFPTPFLLSSSPVSNTGEMIGRAFDHGFGGVAYKTLGFDKIKIIHPSPRMAEYNYENKKLVGLQNVEQITDRPLKDNLRDIKYLKKHWPQHVVIASLMGFSEYEWVELAKMAEGIGSDMLELNFSCPHMTVEGSGMKVGQAFDLIERFTAAVRNVVRIPILAKMTPNITDMIEPALFAKKGGADGITAINTVRALTEIGLDDYVPEPNVAGKGAISGYSGPAVKPIGLRFIAEMAQSSELNLPLAGCGGIETWIDAVEYLLCGASVVQMTTGVIHYGHRIVEDMCEGLSDFMQEKGYKRVKDMVGKALPHIHPTDVFDLTRQGIAEFDLDRCIGCGQCYIVCQDAGGQCLEWDSEKRRPIQDEEKCLSCMICSFICPVDNPPMITYKEVKNKKPVIPQVSK